MKRRGWVTAGMMLAVVVVGAMAILGADASASARPFVLSAAGALLITTLVFLFAWVPRLQAEARSWQVAAFLARHGRTAYNVDGGTSAWRASGLPLDSGATA